MPDKMTVENQGGFEKKYYDAIINNLQQIMKKNKMSQYMLGYKTGISQSTLSKILNGSSKLTIPQLLRICEALDVEPKSVFALGETPSVKFSGFEDVLENDNIVCNPGRTAFKGYLNQSYHIYFYPTLSSETVLLHGILKLYGAEDEKRCRLSLCLFTGKKDMDGAAITKNYSGEMIISITMSTCYCILSSPEIGEVCFFSFHHMFLLNQDMICRVAVALTTSSGENRRPTIHRLLLCREELDITSENSMDLQLIRGQLRLNDSSIVISREAYEALMESEFVKESEELEGFLREFETSGQKVEYYVADEAALRGIPAPAAAKILGISLLRDHSTALRYNKISTRTDEYIFKYMEIKNKGRDPHGV